MADEKPEALTDEELEIVLQRLREMRRGGNYMFTIVEHNERSPFPQVLGERILY